MATVTNGGSKYSGGDQIQTTDSQSRINVMSPVNGRLMFKAARKVGFNAGIENVPSAGQDAEGGQ
jgi:hypothetical protein